MSSCYHVEFCPGGQGGIRTPEGRSRQISHNLTVSRRCGLYLYLKLL